MSRATNKADLIKAANERFTDMRALIDTLSEEEQKAVFIFEVTDKMKEAEL